MGDLCERIRCGYKCMCIGMQMKRIHSFWNTNSRSRFFIRLLWWVDFLVVIEEVPPLAYRSCMQLLRLSRCTVDHQQFRGDVPRKSAQNRCHFPQQSYKEPGLFFCSGRNNFEVRFRYKLSNGFCSLDSMARKTRSVDRKRQKAPTVSART